MLNLAFVRGSSLRRVVIKKRKISLLSSETGFAPISMDLDKLDDTVIEKKMGKEALELIKEISLLNTEKEMAQDIKKDFQKDGWRCIKEE